MTLADAEIGEQLIITSLLNNEFMLKLVEIGFYENKMLSVEAIAPAHDPICISLGNSKIMLRKNEAASVIVRKCNSFE